MINEPDYRKQRATSADDAVPHEQDEAQRTIRTLMRQISKEQARYNTLSRSYAQTVANLEAANRENFELERDRDMWKGRAEGKPPLGSALPIPMELTAAEVSAIRKAMARLHHPDAGGDQERMQIWNATLDALEK